MELEYTPQSPKPQAPPKPDYILVNDVTGKPPPKRGPQTLKAYTQEKLKDTAERKQIVINFKVPYPPKSGCKKCLGRGYEGVISRGTQHGVLICKKCYPHL